VLAFLEPSIDETLLNRFWIPARLADRDRPASIEEEESRSVGNSLPRLQIHWDSLISQFIEYNHFNIVSIESGRNGD
jgi:hypothetical protein